MIHGTGVAVADNIRRILDEKGLKHVKVAQKLGISKSEFSHMLNGKKIIRACHIPLIAQALGCSYDELFAADETKAG